MCWRSAVVVFRAGCGSHGAPPFSVRCFSDSTSLIALGLQPFYRHLSTFTVRFTLFYCSRETFRLHNIAKFNFVGLGYFLRVASPLLFSHCLFTVYVH